MVDPFGVLGLIGTIDTAYHWGSELVEICKAFANAEARLRESVVRVEACWLKIQLQLEFIRRLEPQLDEWHKSIQQQTLEILLQKLHAAKNKLSGLVKKSDTLPNGAGEEAIIVERTCDMPVKLDRKKAGHAAHPRVGGLRHDDVVPPAVH